MGSTDALSHHTDVHDGYNTGVRAPVPRSQKHDLLQYELEALRIGANVDALDGNKPVYEVFIT